MMRVTSLFLVSLLLLAGCESPDRLLTNAERVLGSRTGRTVLDIASGKDPKHMLKERVDAYQRNPETVLKDLRTIQRDFDTIMTGLPQVNSGKLVALGMSNAQRSAMAPQIPTIAEQGYSGYDIAPWYGLVAPHGTPAPVLDKLNQAVNKVLADPALRTKLAETGAEPQGGSREQFAAFIKAELPRTRKLVEQAGITPQ